MRVPLQPRNTRITITMSLFSLTVSSFGLRDFVSQLETPGKHFDNLNNMVIREITDECLWPNEAAQTPCKLTINLECQQNVKSLLSSTHLGHASSNLYQLCYWDVLVNEVKCIVKCIVNFKYSDPIVWYP